MGIIIMGITFSSNTNHEGKIYNINEDTSLVESPFISTETFDEIKNINVLDTPLSESAQSNLSINSFSQNSINANSYSPNSIDVNSYDEGNLNELFVKPSENIETNTSNIKYEISLGSFNTPSSVSEENNFIPETLNSEGIILSINGFSNSFSIESYNQKGGNVLQNSINSEGSFNNNEYRPMDVADIIANDNDEDLFSIKSDDYKDEDIIASVDSDDIFKNDDTESSIKPSKKKSRKRSSKNKPSKKK